MSSLKLSKLKTHAPKKSISVNASVGKTSSTAVPIDSKASIPDKPDKIDSRRNNKVPSKETVKLPSESGLEIHTIQDFTASDLSIIKMLEGDNYKEAYEVINLFIFRLFWGHFLCIGNRSSLIFVRMVEIKN